MAALAGQEQDSTRPVIDEHRALASDRRVQLVPRSVLGISVEEVAGDQAGFADSVEELIAPLDPSLPAARATGDRGGSNDGHSHEGEKQLADHVGKDTRETHLR